ACVSGGEQGFACAANTQNRCRRWHDFGNAVGMAVDVPSFQFNAADVDGEILIVDGEVLIHISLTFVWFGRIHRATDRRTFAVRYVPANTTPPRDGFSSYSVERRASPPCIRRTQRRHHTYRSDAAARRDTSSGPPWRESSH